MTAGGFTFDQIFTALRIAIGPLAKLSSKAAVFSSQIDAVEAAAADASNNPAKYDPSDNSEPMPDLWKTIEPVFKLHDDIQKWFMENEDLFDIPILTDAVDNISNFMEALVYKFLAVLLEPSLQETRNAVKAAADAAQEAGDKSDIFRDESEDSNPSHSNIAKDHFSNLLNQPAGLVATVITNWTTRMVVRCWDERNQNADEMIDYILTILHHPAFARNKNEPQTYMFQAVETWWNAHEESQRATMRVKLNKQSAQKYFEQHDHTVQASDFRGPNKRRYQHGFVFEGSQPELAPPPDKSLLGKTKELIEDASRGLNDAGRAVIDGTAEVINVVGDTANKAVDTVGDGLNAAGRGIEEGANAVGDTANRAVDTVGDGLNAAGRSIAEGANAVGDEVADIGRKIGGFFGGW